MTGTLPSSSSSSSSSENPNTVTVVVRVRPLNSRETGLNSKRCVELSDPRTLTLDAKPEPKRYRFDAVSDEQASQEEMFREVGRPAAEACVEGYNGSVFVYGQTGSGKTYTMHGPEGAHGGSDSSEARGLVPRVLEYVFSLCERRARLDGGSFDVRVSFLEIYNEQIRDLLDDAATPMSLREDVKRGVYAEGLRREAVACPAEALEVLRVGTRNRTVGETTMNRESSRSHSVFTIEVETRAAPGADGVTRVRRGKLHLIDLAGSERQKSTNASGSRLKEASSINKSLSALGNVIMSLADISAGKSRHVPFRDSKLTFLLKDSLGGSARTTVVANVSPAGVNFGETLSTLQFAQRAKSIRVDAVVNEDTSGSVDALQAEIRRLREALSQVEAAGPGTAASASAAAAALSQAGPAAAAAGAGAAAGSVADLARLREVESLLARCGDDTREAREAKDAAVRRAELAEELAAKRERASQSSKMVIKFREAEIARLRKNAAGGADDAGADERAETLQAEIDTLRAAYDAHPEVARLAHEAHKLAADLGDARARANPEAQEEVARLTALAADLKAQVASLVSDKHALLDRVAELDGGGGGGETAGDGDAGGKLNASSGSALNASTGSALDRSSTMMQSPVRGAALEQFEKERWRLRDVHARETAELREACDEARADLDAARRDLESAAAERDALRAQCVELTGSLKSAKMVAEIRVRKLTEQVTTMRDSGRTDWRMAAEKSSEEAASLQVALDDARAELDAASTAASETEAAHAKALAEARADGEASAEARREAAAELATALAAAETLRTELSAAEARAEDLTRSADDAEALRVAAEARANDLSREVDGLSTQSADLEARLERAEMELARASSELAVAVESANAERARADSLEQLVNTLDLGVKSVIAGDGADVAESAAAEVGAAGVDATNVRGQLNAVRARISELEAGLAEAATARDAATARAEDNQARLAAVTEALESARAELVAERERADGAEARAEARAGDVEALEARVAALEAALDEERDAGEVLRAAVGEAREAALSEIDVERRKAREAHARMCAAKADLSAAREELRGAQRDAAEREAVLAAREEELRAEIERLAGDSASHAEAARKAARKAEAAQTARDNEGGVVAGLEARVRSLEVRERDLTAAALAAEASLGAKDARISVLAADNETLRATAGDLREAADGNKRAVAEARKELEEARGEAARARSALRDAEASRDDAVRECSTHRARCVTLGAQLEQRRAEMERWLADMTRLKDEEERAFRDLQAEREESELLRGMVARLQRECRSLNERVGEVTEENARLAGHTNQKQKIQHHLQVKIENNKLRERIVELTDDLSRKERLCARLAKLTQDRAADGENDPGNAGGHGTISVAGSKFRVPFDIESEEKLRSELEDTRALSRDATEQIAAEISRAFKAVGTDDQGPAAVSSDVNTDDLSANVGKLRRLVGLVEEKGRETVELERALKDAEFKVQMLERGASLAVA